MDQTSWTKQSRGGEAAVRKNEVPVGFTVPQVPATFAHVVRRPGFLGRHAVPAAHLAGADRTGPDRIGSDRIGQSLS